MLQTIQRTYHIVMYSKNIYSLAEQRLGIIQASVPRMSQRHHGGLAALGTTCLPNGKTLGFLLYFFFDLFLGKGFLTIFIYPGIYQHRVSSLNQYRPRIVLGLFQGALSWYSCMSVSEALS